MGIQGLELYPLTLAEKLSCRNFRSASINLKQKVFSVIYVFFSLWYILLSVQCSKPNAVSACSHLCCNAQQLAQQLGRSHINSEFMLSILSTFTRRRFQLFQFRLEAQLLLIH